MAVYRQNCNQFPIEILFNMKEQDLISNTIKLETREFESVSARICFPTFQRYGTVPTIFQCI